MVSLIIRYKQERIEVDTTSHITFNFPNDIGYQLPVYALEEALKDYCNGNKVTNACSISSSKDLGNFESLKKPI